MSYVEDAAVVNTDAERAVCEKVGRSVRGLMDPGHDVMPHLSREVSSCYHHVQSGDAANDVVDRKLREMKTANWCRTTRSLIPLHISGAGNCLDAACAIALWGCSFPANLLRRLIYVTLVEFGAAFYMDRWSRQQCCNDTCFRRGGEGWEEVIKYAQPQQHDATLHFYSDSIPLSDAIQVFALANILRRPLVILAPTTSVSDLTIQSSRGPRSGEDIGGIYLPLLWKPEECVCYPLVLANIDNMFIPLVGGDGTADMPSALDIVPLVTSQLEPLRVWFLLDDEECQVYSLMQRYMNVTEVNLCQADSINMVLGARLKYQQLEDTHTSTTVTPQPAGIRYLNITLPTQSSPSHLPVSHPAESFAAATHQPASTPVDLSVTTTQCRQPRCTNLASSFIYPYCYQHIDQKIVENTRSQRQQTPPDVSLMSVACKQAGCTNMCSVFVYPFCYEHIEDKISEHHHAAGQPQQDYLMSISPDDCVYPGCTNRASVNTYPVCYQHLDFFSQQPLQSQPSQPLPQNHHPYQQPPAGIEGYTVVGAELQQSRPPYDAMMKELECKTKGSAARCRSVNCDNFGNSRCGGYCHECYLIQQMSRHY